MTDVVVIVHREGVRAQFKRCKAGEAEKLFGKLMTHPDVEKIEIARVYQRYARDAV